MSLKLLEAVRSFKIRHRPEEQLKLRVGVNTGDISCFLPWLWLAVLRQALVVYKSVSLSCVCVSIYLPFGNVRKLKAKFNLESAWKIDNSSVMSNYISIL